MLADCSVIFTSLQSRKNSWPGEAAWRSGRLQHAAITVMYFAVVDSLHMTMGFVVFLPSRILQVRTCFLQGISMLGPRLRDKVFSTRSRGRNSPC